MEARRSCEFWGEPWYKGGLLGQEWRIEVEADDQKNWAHCQKVKGDKKLLMIICSSSVFPGKYVFQS